jgi:RND family efflux transporter MFP subunit
MLHKAFQIGFKSTIVSFIVLVGMFVELSPTKVLAQPALATELNPDAALTVNVAIVEPQDFTRYLGLTGLVYAWQEVIIAAEVGGSRIDEILVDVGSNVEKGEPLILLSTSILSTELKARQAALMQREAEYKNANASLTRGKSVAERELLSPADLERLEAEAIGAAGRLQAAEADLEAARVRMSYAEVTAPDAGIITSRSVSVGQIAQAGQEQLRLLRQGRVEWRGEVPEAELAKVKAGMTVKIFSNDGREHIGVVRIVSPTVNMQNHTGTVYVDVASDDALRPGMFARGSVALAEVKALMVPLTAMVSSDGYQYVFVVQPDNSVRRQMIETGVIQDNQIEVHAGISTGDTVVITGTGFLRDGDIVNTVGAK